MASSINQLERRHLNAVPFSHYQYVNVTFTSANTDTLIEHSLPVGAGFDEVRYEVVKADRACVVYDDHSATRRPWGANHILLRCNTAGAQVRLRLSLEP